MASRSVNDPIPIKRTFVNASSLGSTAVVAAVSGIKIRVLAVSAIATLANSIHFLSSATAISPTWPLGANGGFVLPFTKEGWFTTEAGEALNVNLSVATATGIQVTYVEE